MPDLRTTRLASALRVEALNLRNLLTLDPLLEELGALAESDPRHRHSAAESAAVGPRSLETVPGKPPVHALDEGRPQDKKRDA
jgi:hypothetical protein